jgi:3-deoxy-7-phosphoheptulonate synthase
MEKSTHDWSPGTWRTRSAAQGVTWPDEAHLARVEADLALKPPLVFAGEARRLLDHLELVAHGKSFLLQAGDCAESFDEGSADSIRDKLKVILQMAVALTYAAGRAGHQGRTHRRAVRQTPHRSSSRSATANDYWPSAVTSSTTRPSTEAARRPDPERLLDRLPPECGDAEPAARLHHRRFRRRSRACTRGTRSSSPNSLEGKRYEVVADEIERALQLHEGLRHRPPRRRNSLQGVDFYTSHEALILPYEEALTRRDSLTGDWYDCSAHMLWIGDRTRQLDGAHVEFLRGVSNPIWVSRSARPWASTNYCASCDG